MRIGIITFQLAWNCGAVLQCYALQEYIKSLGHEVVVINYRPNYKKYRYVKYCNPFIVAKKETHSEDTLKTRSKKYIKKFGRTIFNYRKNSEHIRQYKGFTSFSQEYLNLSEVYTSLEQLQEFPPKCDVYLSGSDQLWNPKLTNNELDPAYFLKFGDENICRITYAISACELNAEACGAQLRDLCAQLNQISLREHEGKEIIEDLSGKPVCICPDPTLLPDIKVFEHLRPRDPLIIENYILVYLLSDTTDETSEIEIVRLIKEKYKKKVLVISGPRHWPFEVQQIRGVLPEEFVYYIRHASYVVCNSFHATVFSILYERQFVTLSFKNRNSRMYELLHNLGLEERMNRSREEFCELLDEPINYADVRKRIAEQRTYGINYLNRFL